MEVQHHLTSDPGADGEYAVLNSAFNDVSHSSSRPSASTARSSESTSRGKLSSTASHRGSHESKPRLSKDQHERLEREFRNNRKPSTVVKKQFSQQLGISLEKVNNWFQNRRAKVKHEEKKQRNNLPPWSTELPAGGVPLSDYPFLNDAFLQIQDPAHVSQPFTLAPQSSFSSEVPIQGPFVHCSGVGECPTIQEEPTMPDDSNAVMSFFGLPNEHAGRHAQLHDVSSISKQFNPQMAISFAPHGQPMYPPHLNFSNGGPGSMQYQPAPSHHEPGVGPSHPVGVPFSHPHASPPMPTPAGVPMDHQLFSQPWIMQQSATHASHPSTSFKLEDAQHMVSQLQAQASQSQQPMTGHQAFSHPTAETNLAVPQPIIPSQPPSFEQHQQADLQESQPRQGQREADARPTVDEPQYGLSRTDSGTSMLAESMGGVNIDSSHTNVMRPPSKTPSASFSQRRPSAKRPAPLHAAASRSASNSGAPLSASDRAHPSSLSTDPHLRRIKSSTGVLNGRIQKSSGQRSPLYQAHFADSHPHLVRQMSTSSLNAALQSDEGFDTSQTPPVPQPPPGVAMHMQHPSNSSGLTHVTTAEENSQTPESVWSRMPSTADTTNTSLYYSMPQTAHTAKSYVSPPHTPMDHSYFGHMHGQPSSAHPTYASGFGQAPLHPQEQYQVQHMPHQAGLEVQDSQMRNAHGDSMQFSTDDLVMNTIPMGQAPPEHQLTPQPQSAPIHHPQRSLPMHPSYSAHTGQPSQSSQAGLVAQQQAIMFPQQMNEHPPDMQQQDFMQHPQHQQFVWNLSPESQPEQRQNQDLQIHQFTPSNPVDPSNLPPKQSKASPRQTYSFQNFGPDYYSSPKSQSSQSKASSPGHLHIGPPASSSH